MPIAWARPEGGCAWHELTDAVSTTATVRERITRNRKVAVMEHLLQ